MANILNIETSSSICSVALAKDGEIMQGFESSNKMDHSSSLAPFVEKCLVFLREKKEKLDAVSVSAGPGSYTGLRIGLSLAKGVCFGYNIPLILISSLEILAIRAIFTYPDIMGNELIVPMIDARRMEVYSAVYDCRLNVIEPQRSLILDSNTLSNQKGKSKLLFIGDGTEKFRSIYGDEEAIWLGTGMPHAKYMANISEKYYREQKFSDIAYSVPNYLKEYQTTHSKNRILNND